MRRSWAGHPTPAAGLYDALLRSKDGCLQELRRTASRGQQRIPLPRLTSDVDLAAHLIGEDFWPCGSAADRRTLEAALRFAHQQGLTERRLTVDDLFAPGTLGT